MTHHITSHHTYQNRSTQFDHSHVLTHEHMVCTCPHCPTSLSKFVGYQPPPPPPIYDRPPTTPILPKKKFQLTNLPTTLSSLHSTQSITNLLQKENKNHNICKKNWQSLILFDLFLSKLYSSLFFLQRKNLGESMCVRHGLVWTSQLEETKKCEVQNKGGMWESTMCHFTFVCFWCAYLFTI